MKTVNYSFSVTGPRDTRVCAYYVDGPADLAGYGATESDAYNSLLANAASYEYVDASQEGLAITSEVQERKMTAVDFVISNDVPLPVKKLREKRAGRKARYPFAELEIGQSFFVPNACLSKKARKTDDMIVFSAVPARKRHPDRKFVCRATVENDVHGVRVWRVAEE